jgi:DNA-binding winged helix-turn-helix (wHTH) protein
MIYVFGDWELDLDLYELRHAGQPIKLEPQVFDVLAYLVQHHRRVVPRQELMRHLWPDQHIGDSALERCIMAARKAIGDNGSAQRVIKTLHRRGYRFMAPVQERALLRAGVTAPMASYLSRDLVRQVGERAVPGPYPVSALLSLPRPAEARQTTTNGKKAKRRSVTVLSCALAYALALSEELGTEAMHDLLDRFFCLALREVRVYGGIVTQFLDDGFVALFGATMGSDDHAVRAVQAAIGLQRRLPQGQIAWRGAEGAAGLVCMGLHTGEVVGKRIGNERRVIYLAVGDTLQLAASLRRDAEPGAILVSETTYRLIQEVVSGTPVGRVRPATATTAVTAYEVYGRQASHLVRPGYIKRGLARY